MTLKCQHPLHPSVKKGHLEQIIQPKEKISLMKQETPLWLVSNEVITILQDQLQNRYKNRYKIGKTKIGKTKQAQNQPSSFSSQMMYQLHRPLQVFSHQRGTKNHNATDLVTLCLNPQNFHFISLPSQMLAHISAPKQSISPIFNGLVYPSFSCCSLQRCFLVFRIA